MKSSDLSPKFKEQEFYEIKELSSILKLNYRTILDLIATGELQAYRIGRVFRISQIQLNRFLKSKEIKKHRELLT
jgi:excisionase family DNA binding protein